MGNLDYIISALKKLLKALLDIFLYCNCLAKLLSMVEKARQTMVKLEEVMRESSRLHQAPALMRRLLQVSTHRDIEII
jgi:hypothetical protein